MAFNRMPDMIAFRQLIKAKFLDHVLSKTDVAMMNEVLCKIVCHNICCLIQESHELGITAEFWSKEE